MNPTVKGYFRLSADQYGLIKDLTISSELGIRNKSVASFTLWAWDNASYEGAPVVYKQGTTEKWFVVLPDGVTTVAEAENVCIQAWLANKTLGSHPTLRTRRVKRQRLFWGEGKQIRLTTTGKHLVETYTRSSRTHLLQLTPTHVTYSVTHTTRRGEEVYSDALLYNGQLTPTLQVAGVVEVLHQRIANHFLYKYHGIVTS